MKIVFLVLLFFSTIFLAGCTQKNSPADNILKSNLPSVEKQGDNGIFNKKESCAKYKEIIETKLKNLDENNSNIISFHYFDRIFYSPVKNSCLYAYTAVINSKIDKNNSFAIYQITDFLTEEVVYIKRTPKGGSSEENVKVREDYEKEIERLE